MNLTPSQLELEDAFESFILTPHEKEFVIGGPAGTGKTFMTKYLLKRLESIYAVSGALGLKHLDQNKTYVTATTNKAAYVLSDAVDDTMLAEPCKTIHSLLGLVVKENHQKGTEELSFITNPDNTKKYLENSLVFVDEASMISKDLLQQIRYCCNKVVYIGDPYQLPPVREMLSSVFNGKVHMLKEHKRQEGKHAILDLAESFRTILEQGPPFQWPRIQHIPGEIEIIDGNEFGKLVTPRFSVPGENRDIKILAWTNKKILAYNRKLRSLYTPSPILVEGEWVICNNTHTQGISHDPKPVYRRIHQDWPMQIVRIGSLYPGEYETNMYKVVCSTPVGNVEFQTPERPEDRGRLLKYLFKQKKYKEYFSIKNSWTDLRTLGAQTIHKSQGSTYREVFLDLDDISRNNKWHDIARLMYVGLTRATDKVYLYGNLRNLPSQQREPE